MNYIKYFGIQLFKCSMLILTSFYLGSYIEKPFTSTDLIAIMISSVIVFLVFYFYNMVKKGLYPIRKVNKISLSVIAIIIAIIVIGVITGEIQF